MSEAQPKRHRRPAKVTMPDFGIYLFESYHAETFRMEMAEWPFHKLCWVSIGSGSLVLEEQRQPIKRDDLIVLTAGTRHHFVDNKGHPLTLVMSCFTDDMLSKNRALGDLFENVHRNLSAGLVTRASNAYFQSEIRETFRRLLREQSEQASGFIGALVAGLAILLVHLSRGCSPADLHEANHEQAIAGIIAYLDMNFHRSIKVDEMADLCGLSRRRFSDLFKQHTGQTLIDYINRKRIDYSIMRLLETGHIIYACHEAGFQELGYFYRVFKKYTGLTPRQYLQKENATRKGATSAG